MLGIDTRTLRIAWTLFLFSLLIFTIYTIRETLVVFVIALFFAYMLSPVLDFLTRRSPKRLSRPVALAIIYLLLVGLLITAAVSIGGRISDEAVSLANRIPDFFQNPDWMHKIPLPGWLEPLRDRLIGSLQSQFRSGGKEWMPYVTSAGGKVVSGVSVLLFSVLVPILAFFFLKDGESLRENLLSSVGGGNQRELVDDILHDIHLLMGQYIRSLVILSAATFTAYSLFLSLTGASYFILLAGVAAVLEFIPVVGPFSAAVIVVLISAFSGYTHLSWFVLFWLASRMFQDYVLSPYLMSSGVELHPLLVLFGVLAGERLAGIPGMFFSVPVLAILRIIYVRAARARRRRDLGNLQPTA